MAEANVPSQNPNAIHSTVPDYTVPDYAAYSEMQPPPANLNYYTDPQQAYTDPQQAVPHYGVPQHPGQHYTYPQQPAYPHPEVIHYKPEQKFQEKFVKRNNIAFLKSRTGIINLINIVLLFFAWVIMVGWRGHNGSAFYFVHQKDGSSFFFAATLLPFFLFIAYVVSVVIGFHTRIKIVNLHFTVIINCGIWMVLLVAASANVARKEENNHCTSSNCAILEAAAAFGFLSAFGLLGEGLLYFKRWRFGETVH